MALWHFISLVWIWIHISYAAITISLQKTVSLHLCLDTASLSILLTAWNNSFPFLSPSFVMQINGGGVVCVFAFPLFEMWPSIVLLVSGEQVCFIVLANKCCCLQLSEKHWVCVWMMLAWTTAQPPSRWLYKVSIDLELITSTISFLFLTDSLAVCFAAYCCSSCMDGKMLTVSWRVTPLSLITGPEPQIYHFNEYGMYAEWFLLQGSGPYEENPCLT